MICKKTFLGIDITPRKELWQDIYRMKLVSDNLRSSLESAQLKIEELEKSNKCVHFEQQRLLLRIKDLERYDIRRRKRNKNGRFVKSDKPVDKTATVQKQELNFNKSQNMGAMSRE